MEKHLVFGEGDQDLIRQIAEYQKKHGLASFIGAVRKLCKDALAVEKITH